MLALVYLALESSLARRADRELIDDAREAENGLAGRSDSEGERAFLADIDPSDFVKECRILISPELKIRAASDLTSWRGFDLVPRNPSGIAPGRDVLRTLSAPEPGKKARIIFHRAADGTFIVLGESLADDEVFLGITREIFTLGWIAMIVPGLLLGWFMARRAMAGVDRVTETAVQMEVLDRDYSPEMPGRLAKLEGAISKQRTIKFPYYSISRNRQTERTVNPYGLLSDNGSWYVIGQDLDRKDIRTFRVSRIRGDIRFATRRERDFRIPAEFDIDQYRGRPPWQIGDIVGEARIELAGDTAWWVERAFGNAGQLEDGVFVTGYSSLPQLASWILRQDGRAIPVEPDELRREVADALRAVRERHEEAPPKLAAAAPVPRVDATGERPAGPVVPERFAVLQALLAYLLAACGESHDALIPAQEIVERFHIPAEELEEHLQLLNLVNFGGGCYTVYAALEGDTVHVDKELYGDTFRLAPRLTPLEARAIVLALEFVGPMIAADAHTPLDRVRMKLEETFGQFELTQTPNPQIAEAEADLVATLTHGIRDRCLVEIEYQKEGEQTWSKRVVEPYSLERELPNWRVHTWDRSRDAERSFRLDRMRSAQLTQESFVPRPAFEPRGFRDARSARILYLKGVAARWAAERGATLLKDGNALAEMPVGSAEWLIGEVLSQRGEAVLLEPDEMRKHVASRARELANELGVSRLRARA
jgi:proteasome accessory factor C